MHDVIRFFFPEILDRVDGFFGAALEVMSRRGTSILVGRRGTACMRSLFGESSWRNFKIEEEGQEAAAAWS